MQDEEKEKMDDYWKKLSEKILEQEKRKEKQETEEHKRFEDINSKIIAIHYLLTFLNCPIPANIQKPFHKLCLEIGRKKPLPLKKGEASHEWEISEEIRTIDRKKAEQLEKGICLIIERIKENFFILEKIKNEPVILNIALQLEYDEWIEPLAELFQRIGVVLSIEELVQAIREIKSQKNQLLATVKTEVSSSKKKKSRKPKKRKK